ncbi:MAG: 4-hydroxyphenylacetate 3-hydroxylase C-terminal domain-containing protein, partial [Nitrosopumilus sp.]
LGRNSVGYLTESMHGAGSPQAQRIQMQKQMQIGYKKNLAKKLAGITNDIEELSEPSGYFDRIFQTKDSIL